MHLQKISMVEMMQCLFSFGTLLNIWTDFSLKMKVTARDAMGSMIKKLEAKGNLYGHHVWQL